jgi:membrane protein implicated in regulation of membrane protease activity
VARLTPEAVFPWKLGLFFVGAFFLVLGMFFERRELVAAAIATLAVAVLLRFVGRKKPDEVHPSWLEEEDDSQKRPGD